MEFFEKIGNSISSASKEVAKKTKEMSDTSKINSKMNAEKGVLKKKYEEIGEAYYKKYGTSSTADGEIRVICETVKESIEIIEACEKELQDVKGQRKCSNCNKVIPNDIAFCNFCGTKVEQTEAVETVEENVGEEKNKCSKCGMEVTEDSAFCANCGNKLK